VQTYQKIFKNAISNFNGPNPQASNLPKMQGGKGSDVVRQALTNVAAKGENQVRYWRRGR